MRKLRAQVAIESPPDSPSANGREFCDAKLPPATARSLKAQAAMEYLVTYGWALLALVFVIALLFGTGAFSVNSFSIPECTFQPDIPCPSFILYKEPGPSGEHTVLAFNISNGLGFPINITNVSYSVNGIGTSGNRVDYVVFSPPISLKSGGYAGFLQPFEGANQPGDKEFKTIYVSLTFYNCRMTNANCTGPYVTSGRISAPVEKRQ